MALKTLQGFPGGSEGKESTCSVGDLGLIPVWEDPLEEDMATHSSIFAWRITMDRGARLAPAHGVTENRTWLSTHPAGSDQPLLNLPAAGLPTCVGASGAVQALLSTPRQPGGKNPALVLAPVPKSQCLCSDQLRGRTTPRPLSLHALPSVPVVYVLVPAGVQSFPSREASPCLEPAPNSAQTLATLSPPLPSRTPASGHWSGCLVTAFPARLSVHSSLQCPPPFPA